MTTPPRPEDAVNAGPRSDYARLQAIAARILGWSPETFWAATPGELAACLDPYPPDAAGAPLSRREFTALRDRLEDLTSPDAIGDSRTHA